MKKRIHFFTLCSLVILSSQSMAAPKSDAVMNSKNEAAKVWLQLAFAGDSTAQFNLAGHYSSGISVPKNEQLAEQYLKEAARSGLVEAYLKLNKHALLPGIRTTLNFQALALNPAQWLQSQNPSRFTIQIASSRNEKSIKRSYEKNNFKDNGGYYHYVRDNIDRYALVYGVYGTVAAANAAIRELPHVLRKKNPWVRRIKSIQKISH